MSIIPPSVCAVMLVNGRQAMAQRALDCFLAQTYPHKQLVVWDRGPEPIALFRTTELGKPVVCPVPLCWKPNMQPAEAGTPLGRLRNEANDFAVQVTHSQVLIHWDSDDWSHPLRIEEQVAQLFGEHQQSRCVGYNEMLFWDTSELPAGIAWKYRLGNPAQPLGTSLCYFADAWYARPFRAMAPATGAEDTIWLGELRPYAQAVTSIRPGEEPRMIASIHGSNTSSKVSRSPEWAPALGWTSYCQKAMAL